MDETLRNAVELWRTYPSIACNHLLHRPFAEDIDDQYTLSEPQRIVVNRVWRANSSIVVACRGFGKTRMAATLAILKAWLYPGRSVGCLSASFRQAKQIFDEIDKIWHQSPLLQQATTRAPVLSNDSCRLYFKSISGKDPSKIMALPLADGSKIRGARFHTIFVDEAVHVPEDVFQMVIRPMAATHQDPMRARRIEQEKDKIRAKGLAPEEEALRLEELDKFRGANEICMLTSGYFSFNYVYKLYRKYAQRMNGIFDVSPEDIELLGEDLKDNPDDYAAFQIPYAAIPKGFLDQRGLLQARRDMSPLQFRMEYEAAWIMDTGGFFKASDIEACRAHALALTRPGLGLDQHFVITRGFPDRDYILSIDPARKHDAFAMVISELDHSFGMKVVYAEQHFGDAAETTAMVKRIFDLANQFNLVRIGIDKGGGGLQIADLIARDPGTGQLPLYDMDDEQYRGLRGRHIVQLVDFTSSWIEGAHHNALSLLHERSVSFPTKRLDESEGKDDNNIHATIEKMINQLLSIQISETRTGRQHFDLPESGGQFEQHKDLYSAFLIGADIAYNMIQRDAIPKYRMPLLGIVTPRQGIYSRWS